MIGIDTIPIIHYFVNTKEDNEARRLYYSDFKRRLHHFEPLFDKICRNGGTRLDT